MRSQWAIALPPRSPVIPRSLPTLAARLICVAPSLCLPRSGKRLETELQKAHAELAGLQVRLPTTFTLLHFVGPYHRVRRATSGTTRTHRAPVYLLSQREISSRHTSPLLPAA